jgi:hypothetical protein
MCGMARGVRTGGQGPPPSFQKTQKVPFLRWQSALCLRETCCSDCIFYDCNYFSFRKYKKCPLSGGKVPFAFVKNVQIAYCMIAVPPPSPPLVANISGKIFQVPFSSKSAPRNRPPPNLLMLPTPLGMASP